MSTKDMPLFRAAWLDAKYRIREDRKFYSQDLINNLFRHSYTKIECIEKDLIMSSLTASKYLEALTAGGILKNKRFFGQMTTSTSR